MVITLQQKLIFRRISLNRRLLLWGLIMPLAFDFKKIGETGGTFIQIILVFITFVCGGLYILLEQQSSKLLPYRSKLRHVTLIWWIFIISSPIPVFAWGVDKEHYLKVLLPFVLFGLGLSIMCSVERRMADPAILVEILVWAGLIGTTWRVLYAIVLGGLDLQTIRWQILGPSVSLLVGFGSAGLYMKDRKILASISLLLGLIVSVLSVTRSFLISVFFILGTIFAIELRSRSMSAALRRITSGKFLISAILIVACSLVLATYFRPDIISLWVSRITEHEAASGLDITMVTRIAEIKGQWTALCHNVATLMLGNGIGSYYEWDQNILSELPFKLVSDLQWFGGHSTWVYTFFSSGVLTGAILPVLLIYGLKSGYIAAARRLHCGAAAGSITAFLIYVSYLGTSFTTNLMNSRYGALIMGLILGTMFLYGRRQSMLQHSYKLHKTMHPSF